ADSAFTSAIRTFATLRQDNDSPTVLALDDASCAPWRYYMSYHPDRAELQELTRHVRWHCTKDFKSMTNVLSKGLKSSKSRVFALVSQTRLMNDLETKLPPDWAIDSQVVVGKHDHLVVRLKQR
ncbi:MAG TPA: hypothetical protein VEQ58_03205, partial [Polyangiaceae bacterium]|nr:hypothetical protein [Polyangiaceae bacterium]